MHRYGKKIMPSPATVGQTQIFVLKWIEINQLDRVQVTVDTTEIDFGVIGFIETSSRALTVANTGQVPVQFEFIKKLNDKSICKSWLSVEPSSGFIMPGDKVGPSQTQLNWLTAGAVLGKYLINLVEAYSFKSAPDPINKFGNSTTTLILIHSIRSA